MMVTAFASWAGSLILTRRTVGRHLEVAGASRTGIRVLAAALTMGGLGLVVAAMFATQTSAGELPTGVERDWAGRLHDVGSGATTLALGAAVLVCCRLAALSRALRRWSTVALVFAIASNAGLLLAGASVGGLRQRLLLAAALLWQLMLLAELGGRADQARFTSVAGSPKSSSSSTGGVSPHSQSGNQN